MAHGRMKTQMSTSEDDVLKLSNRIGSASAESTLQLHELIHDKKISQVKSILSGLPMLPRKDSISEVANGENALSIACKENDADMVSYFLEDCKATTEIKVQFHFEKRIHIVTPLWIASVLNHLKIVQMLVQNGAKVNVRSNTGSTCVRAACHTNNIEVVKYLVENGADLNLKGIKGGTCLMSAIKSSDIIKFLLSKECNINEQTNSGKSALHFAAKEKATATVKVLLSYGCDVNLQTNDGSTALNVAVENNALEVVNVLLQKGGDPYIRDQDQEDVFLKAVIRDHGKILKVLKDWHKKEKSNPSNDVNPL